MVDPVSPRQFGVRCRRCRWYNAQLIIAMFSHLPNPTLTSSPGSERLLTLEEVISEFVPIRDIVAG